VPSGLPSRESGPETDDIGVSWDSPELRIVHDGRVDLRVATLASIAVPALLPFLPLVFFVMPAQEVLRTLAHLLL
jgi:hypothetical protein